MRIAIAQTCPISAPPGVYSSNHCTKDSLSHLWKNIAAAERFCKLAKAQGADVVCFPEYFLQGLLNEGRQYSSLSSQSLEIEVGYIARRHNIAITGTIVHGTSSVLPKVPESKPFTRDDDEATAIPEGWAAYLESHRELLADESHFTLINEAFYIDPTGNKIGSYTKKNLWHPERDYLEPGRVEEPLFDTPWGRAGFLICWDLSHPAAAQRLADQGADLIFAPAYWLATDSEPMLSRHNTKPKYELDLVQSLCSARSFETETILIHSNAGGPQEEGFMGGSGVWAPLMGKVDGFDGASEGLNVVEIDLRVLADARETYKIREDAAARNGS